MERIEKTVFISYRRRDEPWALAVFADLTHHGYDVFIDYDGIGSGSFETAILENIKARAHFLVLLTPTALERSDDPKDWMRREIEAAVDSQRNIVPLMLAGFNFGIPASKNQLAGKLAALPKYNGLPIPEGYFAQAMERLRNKFLNVPGDAILHPTSVSAQQVAIEQKDKARVALEEAAMEDADQKDALTGESPATPPLEPESAASDQPIGKPPAASSGAETPSPLDPARVAPQPSIGKEHIEDARRGAAEGTARAWEAELKLAELDKSMHPRMIDDESAKEFVDKTQAVWRHAV
jgi:hypothetical protein